jgi:hypothetical protein
VKTDLCLRPIFHSKEARADAHVLFAVLAYALSVTIQLRHRAQGGERTTAALLETLERLQLAELAFQTMDGAWLRFERANIPTAEHPGNPGLAASRKIPAAEPGHGSRPFVVNPGVSPYESTAVTLKVLNLS